MPGEYDMKQLQEDAARRAREMQSRARIPPQRHAPPPVQEQRPAERRQPEPVSAPIEREMGTRGEENAPASLLEGLFQDKERTIILALLILLGGEDGSHELMFALMFLLM